MPELMRLLCFQTEDEAVTFLIAYNLKVSRTGQVGEKKIVSHLSCPCLCPSHEMREKITAYDHVSSWIPIFFSHVRGRLEDKKVFEVYTRYAFFFVPTWVRILFLFCDVSSPSPPLLFTVLDVLRAFDFFLCRQRPNTQAPPLPPVCPSNTPHAQQRASSVRFPYRFF